SLIFVPLALQVLHDPLHLVHVLVADAFPAAVAALEAVQNEFPHLEGRLQPAGPRAPALELPAKRPLAGEFLGTQETPLAGVRVGVGPFDFHASSVIGNPTTV